MLDLLHTHDETPLPPQSKPAFHIPDMEQSESQKLMQGQ